MVARSVLTPVVVLLGLGLGSSLLKIPGPADQPGPVPELQPPVCPGPQPAEVPTNVLRRSVAKTDGRDQLGLPPDDRPLAADGCWIPRPPTAVCHPRGEAACLRLAGPRGPPPA
jgi:hypothetical protein